MDYAVIMAGGTGKRLWPLSRQARPKQVLRLIEGQTLLGECFDRMSSIFDTRSIIVLTNAGYADLVRENLIGVPYNNVIAEPVVRDTAGAIGLAATILYKVDPNATMVVVTADQLIRPAEVLEQAITDAMNYVNHHPEQMLVFGIKPTFPDTQLGYIKFAGSNKCDECKNEVLDVVGFREKPSLKTAHRYFKQGDHLWNSGMFVWKARTILENLHEFLPDATRPLQEIKNSWGTSAQQSMLMEWFPKLPKISIDFAVMEKARNVKAIKLDCQWLDMGSFAALADVITSDHNRNIVVAETAELLDCTDSIIVTEEADHLIAAVGLEKIVVAHTPDVTLVCHADHAHRLKELLAQIEQNKGDTYL